MKTLERRCATINKTIVLFCIVILGYHNTQGQVIDSNKSVGGNLDINTQLSDELLLGYIIGVHSLSKDSKL